mmetsp:Transcript_125129/g.186956  ORF Transcript_125129/g.186956 Transcript_125129/m.186956 type:complete len:85 (+) Transcript_125129:198-452(+)
MVGCDEGHETAALSLFAWTVEQSPRWQLSPIAGTALLEHSPLMSSKISCPPPPVQRLRDGRPSVAGCDDLRLCLLRRRRQRGHG